MPTTASGMSPAPPPHFIASRIPSYLMPGGHDRECRESDPNRMQEGMPTRKGHHGRWVTSTRTARMAMTKMTPTQVYDGRIFNLCFKL